MSRHRPVVVDDFEIWSIIIAHNLDLLPGVQPSYQNESFFSTSKNLLQTKIELFPWCSSSNKN